MILLTRFFPLTCDFGLLLEKVNSVDVLTFTKLSLSLLKLDWINKDVRKLHTLTFEDQERRFNIPNVFVDRIDPTKFLLQYRNMGGFLVLKCGIVVNGKICFKEDILMEDRRIIIFSLAGNKLYALSPFEVLLNNISSIRVVNLDQGAQTSQFDLDSLPEQLSRVEKTTICFAFDRLFISIQFKNTQTYGIVWATYEAREWKELNFYTKEPITNIEFMHEENLLLVQTADGGIELVYGVHRVKKTFYRIPLKKPEKLSNLAWFSLVRSKSRLPNVDPYEEARKYLPYSSKIRGPFEEVQ